ncbi:kinesin-like protein KIF13A isoform X2 [Watersipora subatra]|uniref:kinesin-like protein KIF13A isoform X2 n=1 Tax=Watersipora subatra TaxID=2589382 RepID=UPI00355BA3DA
MDELSKVQVAVRLRPMNKREVDLGTRCVVDMEKNQTILSHPDTSGINSRGSHVKHQPKVFAFDNCFWSMEESNTAKFDGQDKVFHEVGRALLQNAFSGYNACIFAYGQTGSGKSYTMMGTADQKGIIPQLCDALFGKITADGSNGEQSYAVEVSYMEIYNEKVHDLLDPASKGNLKVREHKILGPYVDGLSLLAVNSYADIENLMVEGNKSRTVAATNMNSESSRSHAVFTIKLTQTLHDKASGVSGERVSKMSLVDLAGSERVTKTGAIGERLKEGSNINKSLTTLGLVIKALAESSSSSKTKKSNFVPYRDSVLTWLLKDNLGGNSKTVMIATVSPAADNYEETLSTLRYADSAKRIVNRAVVNEDPNAKIIRELRSEVETLKLQLVAAESMKAPDLQEKLQESEKLIEELSKTWEEKLEKTERIHKERHQALESMGVSVETSGIKVDSEKCYLVNLNADPSLNELLVYYLKEVTIVGSGDEMTLPDIQLSGLGILPQHCTINVQNDKEVYIDPVSGARTCINGSLIKERSKSRHGDRILWGNNHFFRLNIPRRDLMTASNELAEDLHVDYDFAQQEIMQQAHDPIQESIEAIERQYEDDKQAALEAQKQMYEQQMTMLRSQLLSGSSTGSSPVPWNHYLACSPSTSNVNDRLQRRIQQMAHESKFKPVFTKLKEDLAKVSMYAREASDLAVELSTDTVYSVTLQIPASNLSPNRRRGALMSEPAILACNSEHKTQVFSREEFESRLVSMREMYQEHKRKGPLAAISDQSENPFLVTAESHDLIGVANVFLDALFYDDLKLDSYVAIINQQGEVAGRLHIELKKLEGSMNEAYPDDVTSSGSDEEESSSIREITLKVSIRDAKGLPPSLSRFVFCQYTFWGETELVVVAPKVDESSLDMEGQGHDSERTASYKFEHEKEFTVRVTEEFIEHVYDGALSIEVYGHSSEEGEAVVGRSLADRWSEVTRKLEMSVEIQELNEHGMYEPVELQVKPDVYCGGVFQLRQGYSRRILVKVRPLPTTGSLPLTVDSITAVSIGGICIRSPSHKGLDSYQEDGLSLLRSRWNEALEKRKQYLDDKMQLLAAKKDKTESDAEREKNLMSQWLRLAEERNNVMLPQPGSGVPGAPATGEPMFGMEHHTPVIYLDLNIEDMTPRHAGDDVPIAELAFLDKEMKTTFVHLPIVAADNNVTSILTSWDSSLHDSVHLNKLTPANERIYMIVKASVTLSHPAPLEITLRKRICVNIYKHHSLSMKLRKKITKTANTMGATQNAVGRLLHVQDTLSTSSILYDIVSNIPKASEELEDRETMAKLAASGFETQGSCEDVDGESYIDKYIKSVAAVESIITLDRLGQEVAIKESLLASGRSPTRTFSSPNINAMLDAVYGSLRTGVDMMKASTSTPTFTDKMRYPLARLSESFQDLSRHVMKTSASVSSPLAQSTASKASSSLDDSVFASDSAVSHSELSGNRGTAVDEGYGSTPRRAASDARRPNGRSEQLGPGSLAHDGKAGSTYEENYQLEKNSNLQEIKISSNFDTPATSESTNFDSNNLVTDNAFQSNLPSNEGSTNQTKVKSFSQTEDSNLEGCQSDEDKTHIEETNSTAITETECQHFTDNCELTMPAVSLATVDSDCGSVNSSSERIEGDILHLSDNPKSIDSGSLHPSDSLKSVDSDSPKRVESDSLHLSDADDNQLAVVEEVNPDSVPKSGIQAEYSLEASREPSKRESDSYDDDEDEDFGSYGEGGATPRAVNSNKKSRVDILSDIYSMNALDDLEAALGDSMESLNCSSDDEPTPETPQIHYLSKSASGVEVTAPAPLLVDDSEDSNSDGEEAGVETPLPSWIVVGVAVIVLSTKGDAPDKGYVQFVGETDFATGTWIGVELDRPRGKNNGAVQGKSYFSCKSNHGVFVRHDRLIEDVKRPKISPSESATPKSSSVSRTAPTATSTPSYLKPTKSSQFRKT